MIEIGMRFQRTGQAVLAERWELAAYDVSELEEVFHDDLFASKWMGNPEVARIAHRFEDVELTSLHRAVSARDAAAPAAFARAAAVCNDCHRTAGMGFIEISQALGSEVPTVRAPK